MKDAPKLSFSRFQTITFTDKINKNKEHQTPRTDRKLNKSGILNPQSLLSTTIHITPQQERDVSLPSIGDKKKRKKRGTFLQSWLDEALGAPEPNKPETAQKNRSEVDGGILKTLKRFELDKRYLQSQNIPGEKVERLYQSLYIYTHGINQVFKQLLEFVKEIQNNDLMGNFWRAFTKLLEGCTSYQTVFQSIEKNHLSSIQRLRGTISTKHEQFTAQKKSMEEKIEKLQRDLYEKQNKFDLLKSQFKILESTLGLTDEAFNEEVHLRLKFQEKINAVYTSYQELKVKYAKIVQEMKLKKDLEVQEEMAKKQLNNELLTEKTKVKQLLYILENQKQKVKDRETELIIKATQLEDLKQNLQNKESKEEEALEMMESQITKQKSLKIQLAEANNVILGQKKTMKELQEHIGKLNKNLEEAKKFNNEIYGQYNQAGKQIVTHQNTISNKATKIVQLEGQLVEKNGTICDLQRQLDHVRGQKNQLTEDLQATTNSLKKADVLNEKNAKLLAEMKAVKDKYERINTILTKELRELQCMYNDQQNEISLKVEEIEGLKLMLDSKNKSLTQLEKQIEQERETQKVKAQAQNSIINKKQSLIGEYQKQKEVHDAEIVEKNTQIKKNEEKIALLQSQKIKLQIQISGKTKSIADLENLLKDTQDKFQVLSGRLEEEIRQKDTIGGKLESTQFVLKTRSNEENVQALNLNNLIKEYQLKLTERAQYVHPMLYEEQQSFAQRAYENQQVWKKENIQMKEKEGKLKAENQHLTELSQKLQEQKTAKEKQIISLLDQIKVLSATEQKQKNDLLKKGQEISSLQMKMKELYGKKEKLEKQVDEKQAKITHQKSLIDDLRAQIKKLEFEKIQLVKNRRPITKQKESREQAVRKNPLKSVEVQTEEQQQKTQARVEEVIEKIDECTQTQVQKKQNDSLQNSVIQGEQERQQPMEPVMNLRNASPKQQKKVPNKDFKKALKLTYMRR